MLCVFSFMYISQMRNQRNNALWFFQSKNLWAQNFWAIKPTDQGDQMTGRVLEKVCFPSLAVAFAILVLIYDLWFRFGAWPDCGEFQLDIDIWVHTKFSMQCCKLIVVKNANYIEKCGKIKYDQEQKLQDYEKTILQNFLNRNNLHYCI